MHEKILKIRHQTVKVCKLFQHLWLFLLQQLWMLHIFPRVDKFSLLSFSLFQCRTVFCCLLVVFSFKIKFKAEEGNDGKQGGMQHDMKKLNVCQEVWKKRKHYEENERRRLNKNTAGSFNWPVLSILSTNCRSHTVALSLLTAAYIQFNTQSQSYSDIN